MPGPGTVRLASRAILRSQSDERLAALAAAGHEAAFDAIVERYRRTLRSYCRRFVADGREDDVVQQAFLNVHRAFACGRPAVALRPWLYAVARNAAIDAARVDPCEDGPLVDEHEAAVTTEDAVLVRERLARAMAGIDALPAQQREALVLHGLEGRSQQEIAELLGLSEGAVRQLVHRARDTLRRNAGAVVPIGLLERLLSPAAPHGALAGGGALAVGKAATVVAVTAGVAVGAANLPAPSPGHAAAEPRAATHFSGTAAGRPGGASPARDSAGMEDAAGEPVPRRARRERRAGRSTGGDPATAAGLRNARDPRPSAATSPQVTEVPDAAGGSGAMGGIGAYRGRDRDDSGHHAPAPRPAANPSPDEDEDDRERDDEPEVENEPENDRDDDETPEMDAGSDDHESAVVDAGERDEPEDAEVDAGGTEPSDE